MSSTRGFEQARMPAPPINIALKKFTPIDIESRGGSPNLTSRRNIRSQNCFRQRRAPYPIGFSNRVMRHDHQ